MGDRIFTRYRAKCMVPGCDWWCGDAKTNRHPGDGTREYVLRQALRHMVAHAPAAPIDPSASAIKGACPVCSEVVTLGKRDVYNSFPVKDRLQRKLLFHMVMKHEDEARKLFEAEGIPLPEAFDLPIAESEFAVRLKRMADEQDGGRSVRKSNAARARERRQRERRTGEEGKSEPAPALAPPVKAEGAEGVEPHVTTEPRRGKRQKALSAEPDEPGQDQEEVQTGGEDGMAESETPSGPERVEPAEIPADAAPARGDGEYSGQSLVGFLRDKRFERSRAVEDSEDEGPGPDEGEPSPDSIEADDRSLPCVREGPGRRAARRRRRRRNDDARLDEEGGERGEEEDEEVRPRRRRGHGSKMVFVAALGLAAVGLGLLVWRRVRGKAGAQRVPMGDLLQGRVGQPAPDQPTGQPVHTPTAAQVERGAPDSSPPALPGPSDNPFQHDRGTVVVPGRGVIGAEYADKKDKFL